MSCKFPRSFIDSILEGEAISDEILAKFSAGEKELEEEEEQDSEEEENEEVEYEDNEEEEETPKDKPKRRAKTVMRRKK